MKQTKSKKNSWKIYILAIISFFVGTSQYAIAGILDKIAIYADVSVSTAGQLITVFAFANAIGTPLFVIATNKFGERKQLLLALYLFLAGTLIMLILPGFYALVLSRIIVGIGTGSFIVIAYSLATTLAPEGNQGSAMATVALGFSASLVFGIPLGRVITMHSHWETLFWIIAFFVFLGIVTIKRIFPAVTIQTSLSIKNQLNLLKNREIMTALSVTIFVFIGYSVMSTYITPFLHLGSSVSNEKISSVLFILGIAGVFGSKFGGFLTDKFGVSTTLFWSILIQLFSLVLIYTVSATPSIIILLVIWMIFAWIFGPMQSFNLSTIAPEAPTTMISINNSFIQFGFAFGALIGGLTISTFSIKAISWIASASIICALCIFTLSLFIYRKKR
jgi:MFS transporter, DHA1 family, putative efflux transporter